MNEVIGLVLIITCINIFYCFVIGGMVFTFKENIKNAIVTEIFLLMIVLFLKIILFYLFSFFVLK